MTEKPTGVAGEPPEPTDPAQARSEVFLRYLDYFRSAVIAKIEGLDDVTLRASILPSGWSPLEMVQHLTAMERRWLVWGFSGQPVADPWYDRVDGRWSVPPDRTAAALVSALRAGGERTRAIVAAHSLDEVGGPSERWSGAPPATLERVLFHVFQEYARHLGHLDVVRELIDGAVS